MGVGVCVCVGVGVGVGVGARVHFLAKMDSSEEAYG